VHKAAHAKESVATPGPASAPLSGVEGEYRFPLRRRLLCSLALVGVCLLFFLLFLASGLDGDMVGGYSLLRFLLFCGLAGGCVLWYRALLGKDGVEEITPILAAVALLAAFLAAGACRDGMIEWVSEECASTHTSFSVPEFSSLTQAPIDFGPVPYQDGDIVTIGLSFRGRPSAQPHPNVFQTAPGSQGIRLEALGGGAGLIWTDTGGVRRAWGFCLTCEPGIWHKIEITGVNGGFLRVDFDDEPTVFMNGYGARFLTSSVKLGVGNSPDQVFAGKVTNFRFAVATPASAAFGQGVYYGLRFLLLALMGGCVLWLTAVQVKASEAGKAKGPARTGEGETGAAARTGAGSFLGLPVLLGYWQLTAGLMAAAAITIFWRGEVLHQGFPYNSWLFAPGDRFNDIFLFQSRFDHFGQAAFYQTTGFPRAEHLFNYPPLTAIVLLVLYRSRIPLLILLAGTLSAAAIFTGALARSLWRHGAGATAALLFGLAALFTSFPLMFVLDRANIEVVCWIVVSLALLAIMRQRWWWAAALIAVGAALKIFPVILFGLLFWRKTWRPLLFGLALTAVLYAATLWIMGPTFAMAYQGFQDGMRFTHTRSLFQDHPLEVGFQHTLYSVVRQLMIWLSSSPVTPEGYQSAYSIYMVVAALGAILLFFGRILYLPMLNKIIALTACCLLLPGWSADYTMLHLYVPWALTVLWVLDHPGENVRAMWWYLVSFAVVFTPQPYFYFHSLGLERPYAGQVKAVALLVLLITSVAIPLRQGTAKTQGAV